MDFLQLCNRTISEAGVELDPLTVGNFASPSDPFYNRIKQYVRDAWFEIQMSRSEWEFKTRQAKTSIRPRITVINGNRSIPDPLDPLNPLANLPAPPPADSIYEGDTTTKQFTVKAVTTLEGSWAAGTARAYLDLDNIDSAGWVFGEVFDEVDPDPLNVNVFQTKWYGQYDLIVDTPGSFEINKGSFYLQDTDGSDRRRLQWVSWETFQQLANVGGSVFFGEPTFVTETSEGKWDFFPRPAKQYTIWFEYVTTPQELTNDDDVPTIPTEYHEAIVWRALMNYADYDEKPQVFARAERRYGFYRSNLETNKLPTLSWGLSPYDTTQF